MKFIEYIREEVRKNNPIFLLSLSASKDEILNADADALAKIINERPLSTSDGKPCRCYCIDCGRKGVPLTECYKNIKNTLTTELRR